MVSLFWQALRSIAHLASAVDDLAVIFHPLETDRLMRRRLDGGEVLLVIGGRGDVLRG